MPTLLVGFDSAWTRKKSGALVGVLRHADGSHEELGHPQLVTYAEAEGAIVAWQASHSPRATIVLLDQPTIVPNATGQRPVERLVASPVSRRFGGVQPANTSRRDMFGPDAPMWAFLERFGGAASALDMGDGTHVLETYPVLALIALDWLLPDDRPTGRLPKYNPGRRKTFSLDDWRFVCDRSAELVHAHGLPQLGAWLEEASCKSSPRKHDQDGLDACLCLLVALHLGAGRDGLLVGNSREGAIVVPHGDTLWRELEARCAATGRVAEDWVRKVNSAA